MLMRPTLREFLAIITDEMMFTEQGKTLLQFLRANPDFHGKLEQSKELQKSADYVKIQSLLYEELYQGLELNELHYEAARLQARLIAQYVKSKKDELVSELESSDDTNTRRILEQVKKYDQLLNQVKGAARGESEKQDSR